MAPPGGDNLSDFGGSQSGEEGEKKTPTPAWVYGTNDHLDIPKELPADFEATGVIATDYRKLCKAVGASPHPALKPKIPNPSRRPSVSQQRRPSLLMRRPSLLGAALVPPPAFEDNRKPIAPAAPVEGPNLNIRSMLIDSCTMQLLSLVLPFATKVRVLNFSDCRLDTDMLRLLRQGLVRGTSVESLQLEWNPFDLPLPSVEEMEAARLASIPPDADGEAADAEAGGGDAAANIAAETPAPSPESYDLEARERRRYLVQSQRALRSFQEWVESLHGDWDAAWSNFTDAEMAPDCLFNSSDFYDMLESRLGVNGPQALEVFDVLDGPDYAGGQGLVSMVALKQAFADLPEEPDMASVKDPIGEAIATYVDSDCILEALSLRSCALTRVELDPITVALGQNKWQLRSINLWDNRICDRGCALLAGGMQEYRGLEYLGLGKNRITDTGMKIICEPFHYQIVDEEGAAKVREQNKAMETQKEAAAKAAAKAKPKAKADAAPPSTPPGARRRRAPSLILTELKERSVSEEGEQTYSSRVPCELKCLVLSENRIKDLALLESLQPLGPRGAELVLRLTAVATALAAKRPELVEKRSERGNKAVGAHAGLNAASNHVDDGWLLRLV